MLAGQVAGLGLRTPTQTTRSQLVGVPESASVPTSLPVRLLLVDRSEVPLSLLDRFLSLRERQARALAYDNNLAVEVFLLL